MLKISPVRSAVLALVVAASAGAGYLVSTGSASADTDPVTGGTATISIPSFNEFGKNAKDVYGLPTSPASLSYDPSAGLVNYAYPITGGDASVNTFFGTLKLGGDLVLGISTSHRQVTLTDIVFDIEDDTVTATVPSLNSSATPTTLVFFDAVGNHDISSGPPETFTASRLELDPAGAKYLDSALRTKSFKPFHTVGSFTASFTNSNDG